MYLSASVKTISGKRNWNAQGLDPGIDRMKCVKSGMLNVRESNCYLTGPAALDGWS
jgi:hypothetical protein